MPLKWSSRPVADQIIHRIFDQRQFTSGEIDYLVKEFGHDRINLEQNFEQVLKLNQDACVIADTNLEDLCNSSERLASNYCDQGMLFPQVSCPPAR